MAAYWMKITENLSKRCLFTNKIIFTTVLRQRQVHVTAVNSVKEIQVTQEGKNTVIEGIVKDSSRKPYLIKVDNPHDACPICRLGLKLRYSDVLIISQFLESDGRLMTQEVSQLCDKSYKEMLHLVDQANRAGLLATQRPAHGTKELTGWEKCNTYFESDRELYWKEIDKKESHYYEKRPKTKKFSLQDVL